MTALTIAANDAHAAACEPKFGDEILAWVSGTAGRQSRELADADFEARTFNYFMIGYDDLNKRVRDTGNHLRDLAASVAADESNLGDTPIKQAIARQSSATRRLNDFYKVRSEIDEITQRHTWLRIAPTMDQFQSAGLHNVGRATLLDSMQQLGDSAQKSLSARYSVFVSVTVDSDGNVTNAGVDRKPDMADEVVLAAASYLPNPYTIAIASLFELGRQIINDTACRKKVDEQQDKVRKAYQLLPTVLISRDDLFKLYLDKYAANIKSFDDEVNKIAATTAQLDATWKQLFAYNMARSQTASTILTTAKVQELEQQYSGSGDTDGIYNNVALSRIAQKMADLNSYVSGKQAHILFACGNLDGYVATEDQSDTLAYTDASFELFLGRAEYVPLQSLVDKSKAATAQAMAEVDAIRTQLASRPCNQSAPSQAVSTLTYAAGLATSLKTSLQSTWKKPKAARVYSVKPTSHLAISTMTSLLLTTINDGGSLCVLIRNGATYSCEAPGSPGSPYGANFDGTYNDPRFDILGGAYDGGYASDNRRVGADIAGVKSNVDSRIADARKRAADAKAALDDWATKNGTFLVKEQNRDAALEQQSSQDLQTFTAANAAALADAKSKLDDFLKQPADPSRTGDLVRSVNARDVALPSLPADRIPVDAPVLPGISARDRIYDANSSAIDQRIARETQKIEVLNGKPQLKIVAESALSAARRFSATSGGQALAQMLIHDSASVRYFGTGVIDHMEITIVGDDGQISRSFITDANALPSNALIARARRFEDDRAIFDSRARTLQDVIDQGQGSAVQRSALVGATTLSGVARQTFYGGDVVTGAEVMHLALAVLDVATSLAPGVAWGRDIYEAVTGRNLITGEVLSTAERTIAVLGAVTGGVAGEGPKVLRAIAHAAELGEAGERAEHILKAADRIDHTIEWTAHAGEQLERDEMIAHQLGKDNVEAALDRGTRFWDVDQQSIVAFEEQLQQGEWRAAAAVDPDNMKLVTVYAEQRSDEALANVASGANSLVKRFRRLPLD